VIFLIVLFLQPAFADDPAAAAKKLQFQDQSVNAIGADFGKLDTTSVQGSHWGQSRLYPIRKHFNDEQKTLIENWGVDE